MKPTFFVAGFPKSGTTSLCRWLAQHPNVKFSDIKEPHFFSRDLGEGRISDLERYEKLFTTYNQFHKISGEGSTNYLYSSEAVQRIINYNSSAKFIVCLRHPVELLPSLHQEYRKHLVEPAETFEEAWQLRGRNDSHQRFLTQDGLVNYRAAGMLGYYCERLLDLVPERNVHFISMVDLRESPEAVFEGVLDFLGLDQYVSIQLKSYNEAAVIRSKFLRKIQLVAGNLKKMLGIDRNFGLFTPFKGIVYKKQKNRELSQDVLDELREVFSKDVELAMKITGRSL